jgi:hypothetical protein
MEMMMMAAFVGLASIGSSAGVFMYKDSLCQQYPSLSFLCPTTSPPETEPASSETPTPSPTPAPAATTDTSGSGNGGGSTLAKRFAPYVLLNNSSLQLISKHKWTTLAFVVGYSNDKIVWDAGITDIGKLKEKIAAQKKIGGGIIVSFGGQSAGVKGKQIFSEIAGKYTDPTKLASVYETIAKNLSSTWLDFDIEGHALNDTSSNDRRNKALALLQKRRKDIRISFTVPTGVNGLSASTKAMLSKAKSAGVRIDVVNIMAMYFTSSKTNMATATTRAVTESKSFIKSLGAKVGVTTQIGKNPGKNYTHENFTTADASKVVTTLKSDGDVALLSFWSLNTDTTKHKNAFTKIFKTYA